MKDTPTKPLPMMPKSAIKKEKGATTTTKKVAKVTPAAKAPKGRKPTALKADKKPKASKEEAPKRKRGRPRNDEKLKNQEKLKETKPKGTPGRKRKLPLNVVIKTEKEDTPSPPKRPNLNMNGNSQVPAMQRPKENSMFLNHNMNTNGVFNQFHNKTLDLGNAKKPSASSSAAASKTVTFQPTNDVFNSNSLPKPPKNPRGGIKGILKSDAGPIQIMPLKDIKVEKGLLPPPVKHHPQRMASLDAMARMHVICIPDRKPPPPNDHSSKAATEPFATSSHQKSLTHERIQFDMKKEGKIVHKQIVKEKQQVFVSVEQSKTVSTKKKKTAAAQKPTPNQQKLNKTTTAKSTTSLTFPTKGGEKKKKPDKVPKTDKKCTAAKTQGKTAASTKVTTASKKAAKDKQPAVTTKAVTTKKTSKQQTKSEVKVKETIRMQKTCTYQSVTTVNNSVPVSHLTTNYSKTKKTVVTDDECKNKINYSSGNSYCVTSDSPCRPDCCKFHPAPAQVIPFAHVQCGRATAESSDFAVRRFQAPPTVIYSPPSPEYGCCCSSPIVQHDPCLLRKSLLTYPHHNFNQCCCDQAATTQYLCGGDPTAATQYKSCEPSPLDLSLATSSSSSGDSSASMPGGHCPPGPLCCPARKVLLLRTGATGGFQNFQATPSYRFVSSTPSSSSVGAPAAAAAKIAAEQLASLSPGAAKQLLAKREKQQHPVAAAAALKLHHKPPHPPPARQFAHGWSWKGKPREKLIALTNDSVACPRVCYPGVVHAEGDVISEKDCVLLRSGPKDTDLPYVAKVDTFWQNPDDGEMMMSLLWYYRPEHTELGRRQHGQGEDEVFASRHRDVNSIACIEDKCHVLTYNEYCRYRSRQSMEADMTSMSSRLVPEPADGYSRRGRLPKEMVATDIVFFCRHVYDFRQKRILKNPT